MVRQDTTSEKLYHAEGGFTLIELIIAMTVGLILLAAMYGVFTLQNKSLKIQEQVAEMQQNVRAGMDMMVREIRMAGYDPDGSLGAGIVSIASDSIEFTYVDDSDPDDPQLKTITYDMYESGGTTNLGRAVGAGTHQPVVEHIDSLTFAPAPYDDNGAITVTLTGRTARPDPAYTHPVHNDHYRRYTLETTVLCRNLKL